LKKKRQKLFGWRLAGGLPMKGNGRWTVSAPAARGRQAQKFFGSFFKKELLSSW